MRGSLSHCLLGTCSSHVPGDCGWTISPRSRWFCTRRHRARATPIRFLTLFRERGLKPPAVYEVRELQTALGLVAAEVGMCLVPVSVEGLRRDNVAYRPLDEEKAVSPIIMSTRKGDQSPEIALHHKANPRDLPATKGSRSGS